MDIEIYRRIFTDTCTIGAMFINDMYFCDTLEDITRPEGATKIFGETAIPAGRYEVIMDYSKHFGKNMPHIMDVAGFTGIRIHSGNKPGDTDGCILVGKYSRAHPEWISDSRITYAAFWELFIAALNRKEYISLKIK